MKEAQKNVREYLAAIGNPRWIVTSQPEETDQPAYPWSRS